MESTVGLCGLGQMGLAVAERLSATHHLIAFDPDAVRRELAGKHHNVTTVDSLAGLRDCAVVVLSLPRPDISHRTCRELTEILGRTATVLETSTVLPTDAVECAQVLAAAGIGYIDAAILSGVQQMRQGQATLLVGTPATEPAADAVLDTLAATREQFDTTGAGMAAKVINNQVAHAVMVVLAESCGLAATSGISLDRLVDMLSKPDGGLIRPLTHRVAQRVAHGDYEGGMPTDAARKDSILALAMAQQQGVPLFATQAAQTVYDLAVARGLARQDYSAVAKLWQDWTATPSDERDDDA